VTYAIEVDNLQKRYLADDGQGRLAVDGLSFNVTTGSIFGLLGPNGAGKSTTVKILSTITQPTSGTARVLGFDVVRHPLQVRRSLTAVLQQTAAENLMTLEDNLLIYGCLHGMTPRAARKRLREIAEEFELGDRLRETMHSLSLGTKRRVQVAKVFMLTSPVLVLDEATTGMDPMMRRRVIDRLRQEARNGRTIVLTTQVLSEAEELCDTVAIINGGRAVVSGTVSELRRRSDNLFRVSLCFAPGQADLESALRALNPKELQIQDNRVHMMVQGGESALLTHLAELSRSRPVMEFEVRGPTLEEIFLTVMEGVR
jgi:ABC-2 type transport system ATP-binding protein